MRLTRQIEILEEGGTIHQETRLWDSREQRTYGMRSKEFAHDYRYFPEPDLLPLVITEEWKAQVRQSLPELPDARRQRFIRRVRAAGVRCRPIDPVKTPGGLFRGGCQGKWRA